MHIKSISLHFKHQKQRGPSVTNGCPNPTALCWSNSLPSLCYCCFMMRRCCCCCCCCCYCCCSCCRYNFDVVLCLSTIVRSLPTLALQHAKLPNLVVSLLILFAKLCVCVSMRILSLCFFCPSFCLACLLACWCVRVCVCVCVCALVCQCT